VRLVGYLKENTDFFLAGNRALVSRWAYMWRAGGI